MANQQVLSSENGASGENGNPFGNTIANGGPSINTPSLATVSPEEMLRQIEELIVENYDLKEALKQNNQTMKDRYEELSTWREKQKSEREFYELKFKEAKQSLIEVSSAYEKLKKDHEQPEQRSQVTRDNILSQNDFSEENEQLKTQVTKLQAEKKDLLGIISELQLKLNTSSEDSFIEIRMAVEENAELKTNEDVKGNDVATCMSASMEVAKSSMGTEELTVSKLLRSLGEETQKVERLEKELETTRERLAEIQKKVCNVTEKNTQTEEEEKKEDTKENNVHSEVEPLKAQVNSLCEELQVAHSRLNDAELMKKGLQEKCQQLVRRVSEMEADCEEKQQLHYANKKLELQVESMKSESKMEQVKMEHQLSQFATLQTAYSQKHADLENALKAIEDLKMRESESVRKEVMNDLNEQLNLAEKALAAKQSQIDEMKQTLYKQEEALDTMSLLRAQLDIYSADFHAERDAREKIHEEKERLAVQLEYVVKENSKLKEDLDKMGRQSIGELQMRHPSPWENTPQLVQRGTDEQPHSIPMHACPKCGDILPDLDTLQIHVMDCIT
ncbi:optineurin [Lissotriton helveticus]